MTRKLTDAEYQARLAEIGKVEALEQYVNSHTKILHRCKKHGEKHLAAPTNCLSGDGLKCCQKAGQKKKAANAFAKAKAAYQTRIAKFGKVVLLGEYMGCNTPVLHRCIEHGVTQMAMPSHCIRGQGLKCCQNAANKGAGERRLAKARATYKARLAEVGKAELLGEYKGRMVPTLHRCLIHGEAYKVLPNNLLSGQGLMCCKRAKAGYDDMQRLRADEKLASSNCHVYLARVNGKYLKPGISNDPEKRARRDQKKFYKGFDFVSPVLARAEAWAIEQSLLALSKDAKVWGLEPEYEDFEGRTELRLKATLPAHWYVEKFHELFEELAEIGWSDLHLKYQQQQTLN